MVYRRNINLLVCVLFVWCAARLAYAGNPDGDLRVEVISAYNLVVDSNVETPATYAPRSAYLGATFYNDGTNDLTDVFAYIGNYIDGSTDTPGIYPSRAHAPLVGPLPGSEFALTHEGGSDGISDATRYVGTIPAGESIVVYWLVSYPNLDENGDAVWGPSVKPDDDLWLEYDIWGTANDAGSDVTADVTRKMTMRNEISAAANKIFPNGANKVPDQYKELLEQYSPSWTNLYSDGTPGTRIWTEGIWYDLGNVGEGFDNDGDLVPDRNAWMQPVGDPSIFDPSAFRLVRTYAMVVVKLKGGGETVYMVEDQLYFENIPPNNGAVGLVRYEFLPLKPGSSSALSPYQEVASGSDNEKFCGDYGATIGGVIASGESKVEIDKTGDVTVLPGGTIDYQIAFTNSGTAVIGDADLNLPLVIYDTVPTGSLYVAGSATSSNTLPTGVDSCTVLFSTNNAVSWLTSEPADPTTITDIQWWLSDGFDPATAGDVTFSVLADDPYTNTLPYIENDAGGQIGGSDPFTNSTVKTIVLGTNEVGDTVFRDDGAGGGTLGNGVQDGTELGISNVTVTLYYDADGDGFLGASDVLLATESTSSTGTYSFVDLGDGNYLVLVDANDSDLPYGFASTLPTAVAVGLDPTGTNSSSVVYLDADFAFAPVLALDKTGPATALEGDSVTYSIVVTNRLEGTGGVQVYYSWSTNLNPNTPYTSGTTWNNEADAYQPSYPDGNYATIQPNGNADAIGLEGFRIASPQGSITKVEMIIPISVTGLWSDDNVSFFDFYTNGVSFFSTNHFFTTLTSGDYIVDLTSAKTWSWSDFGNSGDLIISIIASKSAKADGGIFGVDQAGFRVTSDWVTGSNNPSLSLDPVPLTDTYDADKLQYVSADPEPTTVTVSGAAPNTVGTLYWSNLGPIYEGGSETISINYDVLEPPSNSTSTVTNVAYVANATYGDGRPANSITDEVATVVSPAGTIGNYVWRDLDSDGVQDGGAEVGIAGVSVVLTPPAGVDAGNGAGNPVTNVTDSTGYYLFTGLPADGLYTVVVDTSTLPGGLGTNTYDEDSGTNSPNSQTIVTLDYDATDGSDTHLTADFGYVVSSTIDGTVWHDYGRDGNSSPDVGEEWLTGVTVYLYAGTTPGTPATAIATNTTDANGYFLFVGSYAGDYTVQVVTNSGDMASGSWIESFDTDGVGTTDYVPLNLVAGGTARADYSYYSSGLHNIGDTLFYDWNGDSTQNTNDEGIVGITISLYADDDGDGVVDVGVDALIGTDVTDADGKYLFSALGAGDYIVVVDESDPQFPPRFLNTLDPYGANDGVSLVTLTTGNDLDQDFGYQPYGNGSIGDTVWKDINGDGIQSGPREVGLGSITVTLQADFNGDGTYVGISTNVTDSSGYYLFEDLPDGDYRVLVSTGDTDLPDDFFGNAYIPSTDTAISTTISGGNSFLDADFGFMPLGAIGDTIFWDANENGTQDWNENGATGVTVNLYLDVNGDGYYDSGLDTFFGSDLTDTNGNYIFTGLSNGLYVVVVSETGPLTNSVLSADPSSDGVPASDPSAVDADGEYGVQVLPGTVFMGADFGYVPAGIIGDALWIDLNNDGVYDANESGIGYVTVELYTNGTLVATVETDSDGYYIFSDLSDDVYTVVVSTNDVDFPASLGQVFDPDGVYDSQATNIVISNGVMVTLGTGSFTNELGVDFGYRFTGANSLSGTVGLDDPTYDGVLGTGPSGVSSNEVPYGNVTLYLYFWGDDNSNNVIDSGEILLLSNTSTSNNGDYSFINLPDGSGSDKYIVSLSAPEDYLELTTTNGVTPATIVSNTVDVLGYTLSAYQAVPVAPAITNMDFAFKSAVNYDFGDLPSSYSTQIQDQPDGARHKLKATPNLYLGATVDSEINGAPSVNADGDGVDEDGVGSLGIWRNGGDGQIEVIVGAGSGWLVGFIDFGNDGDMLDAGDMIISQAVAVNGGGGGSGIYTNTITIPADVISSTNLTTLYARFRLFDQEPGFPEFAYSGKANNGEVEDYLWRFGTIGDLIWKDIDGDGVHDASEPGISGVRVFVDLNDDGLYQTNEPSAITDASGLYGIGGFSAGSYTIAVDTNTVPVGFGPSYDLDGKNTPHTATATLTNGQVRTDVDFGYQPMALGGMVWYDTDADGLQDESSLTGVSNVIVRLYDAQTNWLDSAVTDTNGTYLFEILTAGGYFLEFLPIGYDVSPIDQGGDDTQDSDVATNASYWTVETTIVSGERETDWDMGIYRPAESNSIGNRIWFDTNRDGVQDAGETNGVGGMTVTLYDGTGSNILRTTTTDVEGYYYFAGLPAGNYYLHFDKPSDYFYSPKDMTGDSIDSDAGSNGFSDVIAVVLNNIDNDWDVGIYAVLDLGVTKTVNDSQPDENDVIWYTITLTNSGPSHATDVLLVDDWPTNITFTTAIASVGTTYTSSNGVWDVGTLLSGSNATLLITGVVDVATAGLTITNTITITNVNEPDTNSANDSASATIAVAGIDLGVVKMVDDANPYEGSNVIYTITVTNYGPNDATSIVLSEPLAEGIGYVSDSATTGTYDSASGVWDGFDLAVSNSATLWVTCVVSNGTGGTSITNTSVITGSDQADVNSSNDSDDAVIVVVGADLAVTKTTPNFGPNEGDTVVYNIVVENLGPNDATGVVLYEPLTNGLNYVSHTNSAGTYTTNNWQWDIGDLALGSNVTLDITCTVGGGSKFTYITNVSSIIATDLPDPDPSNDSDYAVIGVSDLQVSKTSDVGAFVLPGDDITYTIVVTNVGVPPHTGVTVIDPVPEGVSYVVDSMQITYPYTTNDNYRDVFDVEAYTNDDGSLTFANSWQEIGDDAAVGGGDVRVLTDGSSQYAVSVERAGNGIWRAMDAGGYRTATLTFDYRRQGLDNANDYVGVWVSTNGNSGWVEIGRVTGADNDSVYQASASYDISGYISTNMAVRFLSSGMGNNDFVYLDNIDVSMSKRLYRTEPGNAPPSFVTGLLLLEDEYLEITYDVTVDEPPTVLDITNTVSVTSDLLLFPQEATVVDPVEHVDLGVTKIINDDNPGTNEVVWYTITVTNYGPHAASNIELTEAWPDLVTFSNAVPSTGSYSSVSHTWDGFSLEAGASASLVITGRVSVTNGEANVDITNVVWVSALDQYEANLNNNTDNVAVVTLVVLSRFEAFEAGGQAVLEWETASEIGTAGFILYRETGTGWVRINNRILPAVVGAPQGGRYHLVDKGAAPGRTYRYRLEELEVRGNRNMYGPFAVTVPVSLGETDLVAESSREARVSASTEPLVVDGGFAVNSMVIPSSSNDEQIKVTSSDPADWSALRLGVIEEGIYYVSAAEIAAVLSVAETNVSDEISGGRLLLKNRGLDVAVMPDGLGEGIYFYGEQLDSIYTYENVYLLEWAATLQMTNVSSVAPAPTDDSLQFRDILHVEENHYSYAGIATDPESDYWLWDYMFGDDPDDGVKSFTLNVPGLANTSTQAVLAVHLMGGSDLDIDQEHHVEVSVNGSLVGEAQWSGLEKCDVSLSFDQSLLVEGSNSVEIAALLNDGVEYSTVYVDSIDLSYQRHYQAVDNVLSVRGDGNNVVTVGGFTNDSIHVLDVSDPLKPGLLQDVTIDQTGGYYRVSFVPLASDVPYALFSNGSGKMVSRISQVESSNLRAVTNDAEYLIITVPALKASAEYLAAYRTQKGLKSKVVLLESIYDEFNDAIVRPQAIRDFLVYAYNNWQVPPKYMVLAGHGSYDYKNYKGYADCLLPPVMVFASDGLYSSDSWYGNITGGKALEIAVGRLPAMTAGGLTLLIDKIKAYEADDGAAWKKRMLLTADDSDKGGDFSLASEVVGSIVPEDYAKTRVYLSDNTLVDARNQIITSLNEGAGFMSYFGHGGVDRLADEGFLTNADVSSLVNGDKQPVLTGMSCAMGRFALPGFDCLGEALLLHSGGGASAVWAPSGLSLNRDARVLGESFYRAVFSSGNRTVGDAILRTLREYESLNMRSYMMEIYNLLGDPAMVMQGVPAPVGTDVSFNQWSLQRFTGDELNDLDVTGENADPDGDGAVNLLEFAMGGNPMEDDFGGRIGIGAVPGMIESAYDIVMQYRRLRWASGLSYFVDVSSDLKSWSNGSEYVIDSLAVDDGNGETETVNVYVKSPAPLRDKCFVRLRVIKE